VTLLGLTAIRSVLLSAVVAAQIWQTKVSILLHVLAVIPFTRYGT